MVHWAAELQCLRDRAERCYRLARCITDREMAAALNALGRETDRKIALLEAQCADRRSWGFRHDVQWGFRHDVQ
jgi:hypothetical protein